MTRIEQERHMETQQFSVHTNPIRDECKRHKLSRIVLMIEELSLGMAILNGEIAAREKKSGISDPKHFAYPSYAKAAAHRRDNLLRTIEELKRCAALERMAA
jgi:flagellar protein FliJ